MRNRVVRRQSRPIEALECRKLLSADVGGEPVAPAAFENLGTLAPTVFTSLPDTALAGGKMKGLAEISITNVAEVAYNGPVTVNLYVTTDDVFDAGDTLFATTVKKLKIEAAGSKTVKMKLTNVPQVPDGAYFVIAEVSGTNVPPGASSSDESIIIAAPFFDLAGSFTSVPQSVVKGKRAKLTLAISNGGNVNATGTVPIAISAATDSLGTTTTPVSTVNVKLNVKPGTTKTVKLNFTVPAETPAGTYFVVANLDSTNVLAESSETNNTVVSETTLTVP